MALGRQPLGAEGLLVSSYLLAFGLPQSHRGGSGAGFTALTFPTLCLGLPYYRAGPPHPLLGYGRLYVTLRPRLLDDLARGISTGSHLALLIVLRTNGR